MMKFFFWLALASLGVVSLDAFLAPSSLSTRTTRRRAPVVCVSEDERTDAPDEPFYFQDQSTPKERDKVVPALTLLAIAALFGTYAFETLRLIKEGQFYFPHL